jgi:hypothetical protein
LYKCRRNATPFFIFTQFCTSEFLLVLLGPDDWTSVPMKFFH